MYVSGEKAISEGVVLCLVSSSMELGAFLNWDVIGLAYSINVALYGAAKAPAAVEW
jgi:hypothetical protein